MPKNVITLLLCLALSSAGFSASAELAGEPDQNLAVATDVYLANGVPSIDPLLEAIDQDSKFHHNLQVALKTIVQAPISDQLKIERLRDLQANVERYAKMHNEWIHSTSTRLTVAGALIGMVLWMVFGPNPTSFDHFERLVVPFSEYITKAFPGFVGGGFIGLTLGVPLQIYSLRTLIRNHSIRQINRTCEALIEQRLARKFQ